MTLLKRRERNSSRFQSGGLGLEVSARKYLQLDRRSVFGEGNPKLHEEPNLSFSHTQRIERRDSEIPI